MDQKQTQKPGQMTIHQCVCAHLWLQHFQWVQARIAPKVAATAQTR